MGRRLGFAWVLLALLGVAFLVQRPSAAQGLRNVPDLAMARDLYARLARQHEIAALSVAPLTPTQIDQLHNARVDTATALTRLACGERDIASFISVLGGPVSPSDLAVSDAFQRARHSVSIVEKAFADIDTTARPVGADKGRLVISREQAMKNVVAVDVLEKQPDATRLPDRLAAWQGFVNPRTRKPYDYEREVKNFRDFSPVGGGVHMGATARLEAPIDLRDYALAYTRVSGELVLIGPDGDRYSYGAIEPDVLKALYRFAASGQNAAISIGWAGQFDRSTNGRRGDALPQPILLDPIFADTRVGQDLIAADASAWYLEDAPFKEAYSRFTQSRVALVDKFSRTVPPLTYASGLLMSGAFAPGERATYLDLLVYSVLTRKTLAAAKTAFLSETNYDLLAHEELLRLRLDSPDEPRKIRTAKTAIEGLVKLLAGSQDRLQILASAAAYAMDDGETDAKWIRLFTAALRAQHGTSSAYPARAIYDALPMTTLAVLMDDTPKVRLTRGRVQLEGTLRYRYASTMLRLDNGVLSMSDGSGANRTRVETIAELTNAANGAMGALLERYPSMQRVGEYSRIVAFLRWARRPGNLAAVDLSDLGPVRVSDRDATPTADALLRQR